VILSTSTCASAAGRTSLDEKQSDPVSVILEGPGAWLVRSGYIPPEDLAATTEDTNNEKKA